jgi:nucleoside-diphosphate-sugar epimerase
MSHDGTPFNEKSRTVLPEAPYGSVFAAYQASKIKALNDSEAWVEKEKPHFDLISPFPSFVVGRDELVTDVKDATNSSNAEIIVPVTGGDRGYKPGGTVSLQDVAKAHVVALKREVPGNQGYVLNSGGEQGSPLDKAWDIVSQHFQSAIKSGILSQGKVVCLSLPFDSSKSEEKLGIKFKSFEEQVIDSVGWYVELATASG